MHTYEDALLLAVRVHAKQKRWNGDPYITHPIRVAKRARLRADALHPMININPGRVRIVAVLHDTVEDCDADQRDLLIELIQDQFGQDVLDDVLMVTRLHGREYSEFIDNIVASDREVSMIVKAADLEDNLSDLAEGHGLRKRYEPALKKIDQALLALVAKRAVR